MNNILQEIIANKRIEVERQKQAVDLHTLIRMGGESLERETRSMKTALTTSSSGIIAEFKRKSPSKGWLFPDADVEKVVAQYEENGASACSILTDEAYFGGSLNDLQQSRKQVKLPLLRKDFIIDEYQIYQSRIMGADAILLIASALTTEECLQFAKTAHSLSLEVLLEIHNESELNFINPYINLLGINNRNLETFHTDIENSFRLAEKMQAAGGDALLVSESGISDTEVIKQLRACGFRGFLIGETFMKTKQPGETLSNFIHQLQ
ncbi:indole-3-glycerol phosphate synthase [Parabacteroides sp. PF5-5]|uniref:indole-3-glycerol phosphate synthase TrpC n=1 Tax=unclassified Parabacteroides TaxID=2649774 RepID=UPI002473969B|nr:MULTISPECIES: indole-3-glycerol phosphate synthase TrpC [unclassified Parabacteroides]MDH6305785.1 indole-3-glycerol phosphate synthase [Parabacteroides sp. PH5-39]MDH6317778.1 indole-3-glycerol phosphate synthase [Parabacteroides sp. PF5-13]MDH6320609.1 indole-3-glycerol phosphate synthase [Parabacteroides sp. PH5-13]MDH6324228.1 indole-3-glycerol phosphate synthase [Parabacteroides sp. PH5-8]MDH6328963.1 indole-3-glycerol phosphate synthase [Parabacteroides sp. PH5-41]